MIVRAYHETFGLPINITRCSNNYVSYQCPENLVPLMIHNALHDKSLPVYGDGLQIWDWLHVKELGKPERLITYVQNRPSHDRRYAIDNTRITTELGRKPAYTFEDGIRETIRWYLDNQDWVAQGTEKVYGILC